MPKPKFSWVTWALTAGTIVSVILEIVGAATHNSTKDTWTELISTYIPWEASLAIYGALVVWLPFHFYRNYKAVSRARMTAEEQAETDDITQHIQSLKYKRSDSKNRNRKWQE